MSMWSLPKLPYPYKAYGDVIQPLAMRYHHQKHQKKYLDGLNEWAEKNLAEKCPLTQVLYRYRNEEVVRKSGCGFWNHSFLWKILSPQPTEVPPFWEPKIQAMKEKALSNFGSGWYWVYRNGNRLQQGVFPNQENPWLQGNVPVFGIDLWEHAYYLTYGPDTEAYVDAVLKHVQWSVVNKRLG